MIQQNKAIKLLIILIFILSFSPIVASAAPFAYITNYGSNSVSVIDTSTNTVTATVTVGTNPYGVAVNPAGTRVYVSNRNSNSVSVIDTSTNTVTATVTVGTNPRGVAVNPAGTRVYVLNYNSNNVSVIDTSTNTVTATVTVGTNPIAFGIFISPGGASDTTAPGIKISTPQEGKSYNTSTIALNVTADESIDTWQYSINGTANVTFTSNTTLSSLPDGNHNVTVYANDSAGNIGSAIVNFTIDTTPPTAPTITIDLPQEGANYITSTVALNVTADESIVTWQYSINGTANVTFTPNITLNSLPDGDHNVTVYANDSAGNMGSALVNFSIDTTAPAITIATPTASLIAYKKGGQQMYVNFTYVEANPKNYTVLIQNATDIINSITAATTSSPVNVSFTMNATAADGYYNVTVTMWNATNTNAATEVEAVLIDSIPPTAVSNLIHTDDAPDGYDNDNSTDISWTASNDASPVIYRIYRDGVFNDYTESTTYTFIGETEGSHEYNVSANDSAGNINTTNESVTVTVDYTDPVIHNVSLSDNTTSYGQQIVVSVNATDTITNIKSVTVGGTQLTHQTGMLWNGTITAGYGTNTVTVTAYDNASNSATNSSLSYIGPAAPKDSSGGGSGGSGGSGGGASGELYDNIACSETDRQYVNQNSDIIYSFELECNIVQFVKFTSLKSAGQVATKVEILKDTSALVDNPPSDIVYKNLNIWVGNAGWGTKRNIADATVVFTVDESWITENNIDESSIALYRYSDDTWHKLVTRNIAEDANSLQFEAETPGFSPFAVTGKELVGEPGGEGIVEPTVTAEKTPIPTPTEKKGIPGFSLFTGLSILLIAVQLLRKKN